MTIYAVIMAGGSGTRLWPLSRKDYPKQFLSFSGNQTMLQATVNRLRGLGIESVITICNEDHRFFVQEQLRGISQENLIILEPEGKNTGPAIALAALSVDDDALLLVLAADHLIKDEDGFRSAVKKAIPLADAGKLVTFGVVPKTAHTGYGYIMKGSAIGDGYDVKEFKEKPSQEIAGSYFESGDYMWNSGMFLLKAGLYLKELQLHRPKMYEACERSIAGASEESGFLRPDNHHFSKSSSESIDYAVMENTSEAVVVPMDSGWSDIGSWASLWDISSKDADQNVVVGDVILHDVKNSYVRSEGTLVSAVGVEDLVIVATKDAVMVSSRESVDGVKQITKQLKNTDRPEGETHREVYRPWGKYDSVDKSDRYQVKRITVNPGAKLSVQMHHHRAEHWVVVAGTAKVTKGGETFLLSENESTYIPIGVVHALENPGKVSLELIEVQTGSYLGEDDIVRFDDQYGRVHN
jgi:mannose-1-phosphate guanylyltransferase